jgi:hypothetical protein
VTGGFTCPECGEWHPGTPRDVGAKAPDTWLELPVRSRMRSSKTDTRCRIRGPRGDRCFLRGVVWIPVGIDDHFRYGVWGEVAEADFRHVEELWDDPGLLELDVPGTLDTELPDHPGSRGLPVRFSWPDLESQPSIEVLDGSHSLAREQRQGIDDARADALAAPFFH